MNWKFTGDRPVYQQIMAAISDAVKIVVFFIMSLIPNTLSFF